MTISLRRDLLAFHRWGNQKVLDLAEGLDDAALDEPVEMGVGSLRATLYHLVTADELWLDRWKLKPWAPLDTVTPRISLAELRDRFESVHAAREAFLDEEGPEGEGREIAYKNSRGEAFRHPLGELVVHVANHGVHHRAQALNMLRRHDRKALGLDYLFFRVEQPTVEMPPESVAAFRKRNFGIALREGEPAELDQRSITRYFAYSDWATARLYDQAAGLGAEALDRPFEMGPGSLRKTFRHLRDAEDWWYRNWTEGASTFAPLPDDLALAELRSASLDIAKRRQEFLEVLKTSDLAAPVEGIVPGNLRLRFRLGETMIQLCGHGTHHRAQIANMLRQVGVTPKPLDYVVWLRETGA